MPAWVGRSVASVCLFVRALKWKPIELSTPNLVHVYSIAVAWHASTQRSKGQRSHGYENVAIARLLVTMFRIPHTNTPLCYLRPLPALVCMSIRLPMFSTFFSFLVPHVRLSWLLVSFWAHANISSRIVMTLNDLKGHFALWNHINPGTSGNVLHVLITTILRTNRKKCLNISAKSWLERRLLHWKGQEQ